MLCAEYITVLAIPKTGTTWVRESLKHSGVHWKCVHAVHGFYQPEESGERMVYTVIRNPRTWLRSAFWFTQGRGQLPFWPADPVPRKIEWQEFIEWFIDRPGLVKAYFDQWAKDADYIGTTDRIAECTYKALRMAGHEFDESALMKYPPANVSGVTTRKSDCLPAVWDDQHWQQIIKTECDLFEDYPEWVECVL